MPPSTSGGTPDATVLGSEQCLIPKPARVTSPPMSFYVAILAWLVIGAILVTGVVLATKGMLWLLIVGAVLFIGAFAKWGCATH